MRETSSATVALAGDVMLGRLVNDVLRLRGPTWPWGDLRPLLVGADLTIVNLECVIARDGRPWQRWPKVFHFRVDPIAAESLKLAGIDAVGLANNHILDYDGEALAETIELLAESGVVWFGAGNDISDARRPAFVESAGVRVAFLAYNEFAPLFFSFAYPRSFEATATQSGTAPLKPTAVEADIRAAKAISDAVAVYLHWGVEEADLPRPDQRDMARGFIAAGADLIVGTHPHVLQGFEIHDGRLIAYSLGNYVYDQKKPRQVESLILTTAVAPAGTTRPTVVPVHINDGRPQPVVGDQAATQLNRLAGLCSPLGTKVGPPEARQGYVVAVIEPLP